MDKFFLNLKSKIKEARKRLSLTQVQFADKLDVTQITVSRWETGERVPNFNNLATIAAMMGEDIYYFFSLSSDSVNKNNKLTESEAILLMNFRSLNKDGQERALENVELLKTKYSISSTSKVG